MSSNCLLGFFINAHNDSLDRPYFTEGLIDHTLCGSEVQVANVDGRRLLQCFDLLLYRSVVHTVPINLLWFNILVKYLRHVII